MQPDNQSNWTGPAYVGVASITKTRRDNNVLDQHHNLNLCHLSFLYTLPQTCLTHQQVTVATTDTILNSNGFYVLTNDFGPTKNVSQDCF